MGPKENYKALKFYATFLWMTHLQIILIDSKYAKRLNPNYSKYAKRLQVDFKYAKGFQVDSKYAKRFLFHS